MPGPLVLNLFAGPSSGKSTMAAGLFYQLKRRHVNAELVSEYAKNLTWAKRHKDLKDQIKIFGKQQAAIETLAEECDVIVTDSPVLMGLVYAPGYPQCFRDTVAWSFARYTNLNFLVQRTAAYNPVGRNQDEAGAAAKHREIVDLLAEFEVDHHVVTGDDYGLSLAMEVVLKHIGK